MKTIRGLSLLEIMISLVIFAGSILMVFGVMGTGLIAVKKGENTAIATNIAQAQFEAYEGNFHMIPFYDGLSATTIYPNETDPDDPIQTGKFVHHEVSAGDIPTEVEMEVYGPADDFYHNVTCYDLNGDTYANDILEPLEPTVVEGIKFTPVVEVMPWANGFDINEIKHVKVYVYWMERDAAGTREDYKNVSFEGYIVRTKPSPW